MPWVVQWRSDRMTAPAFWYYRTKVAAERAARGIRDHGGEAKLRHLKYHEASRSTVYGEDIGEMNARRESRRE